MIDLTIFLGAATDTTPTDTLNIRWEDLEDTLHTMTNPGSKGSAGYIVAGVVTGKRSEANCGPATMLVVDYEPPASAESDWDQWPCEFLAHTTDSHLKKTDKNPDAAERWRVFLRVSGVVPAAEYKAVARSLDATIPAGSKIRGRSQPAFLPTREDTTYRAGGAGELDWSALLVAMPRLAARVPTVVSTDRTEDPTAVPTPERWERLISSWVQYWPETNRHDASLALGGLLARGSWPESVCEDFAEEILTRTDSNVSDGLGAVRASLSRGPGAEGVYGIPKLIEILGPTPPEVPRAVAITMFLEAFLAAMQPAPTHPVAIEAVLQRTAAIAAGEDPDELQATLANRLLMKNGAYLACAENVCLVLELYPKWRGVFGWDELANKVVILRRGPEGTNTEHVGAVWSADDDVIHVQRWLTRFLHMKEPSVGHVIAAVRAVSKLNSYHPVRQYLSALRGTWDGVDRNLVGYLGAEPTDYHRAVCAAWLRSAVARAFEPGCQADEVLILEGNQGARKSSLLRALCPSGAWFFNLRADLRNKDFLSAMRGKWIGEIAEIDRLINGREASELKDVITVRVDTYRPAFGREDRDFPRECVICGSTNQTNYFKDETGNRRYRPVQCGAELAADAVAVDRDQIWAQAVTEYDLFVSEGRRSDSPWAWWLNNSVEGAAQEQAAMRAEHDGWEELITEQLSKGGIVTTEQGCFTTLAALGALPGAIPGAQVEQKHSRRMSKVLRKLGYTWGWCGSRADRVKGWTPIKESA
jgi:hypothetical protein